MRPKVNATSDSDLESIFSIEEPSPAGKTKRNEAKYVCTIEGCGQSFKRMVHLDRHEYKHTGVKKHPCIHPDCNKSYTIITHLKRHVKEYHEKTEKPKDVKCRFDFCDKMFISTYNMERHIREVHENPKIYTCSRCNESFKQRIKLKRHEVKHTGVTPFNCEKCKKGFVQEYFFKRHICKSYVCNVCEKSYEKWSELLAHRKAENHKQTIHKCERCDKIFKSKYDLETHEISHKDDEEKEVFVCTFEGCGRFYSFQKNLVQHIRVTHEGHKFPCTVEGCKANLGSKRALDNHVKAIHSEKKTKVKKSKETRAQRKDAGTRKRSALSKLSGVLMDKEFDKKIMEGTADIEINITDADVSMQDEEHCSSDVEGPALVVLEIGEM